LSDRERQVAQLVASGSSNREVAEQLSISERTAKAHLTSIFEKLGLRDRLQLSLKINGLTI
jgi:DNA-binding NarL/FixJ family response regulator